MEIINANAIMKKKKTIPEDKVQGRSYTSNATKLLKHMDRLQLIQNGEYDLVESKGFQTVNDEECLLPDEVFGTNGAEEDSG